MKYRSTILLGGSATYDPTTLFENQDIENAFKTLHSHSLSAANLF